MKTKNNLALIGMPAAGKSTIGSLLADTLGLNFIDTDTLIEESEGMTLAQIIRARGLDGFLDVEAGHLESLSCHNHVIATGGSVIYRKPAMDHLSSIATIVYLCVDLERLKARLSNVTARGVAISPGKKIEDLYKERTPLYNTFCDIKVNCRSLSARQVAEKIVTSL